MEQRDGFAPRGLSAAREARGALLHEGGDPLDEVWAARQLALDGRLELQLLAHARELPLVELALGARVGARRPGSETVGQLARVLLELGVGHHAVDQAPFQGLLGRDALA